MKFENLSFLLFVLITFCYASHVTLAEIIRKKITPNLVTNNSQPLVPLYTFLCFLFLCLSILRILGKEWEFDSHSHSHSLF